MSKSDAMFWGAIGGVIPSLWVGAYLFHIAPIHSAQEQWWGFPWYMTVLGIVTLTDWLCAICASCILTKTNERGIK